MKRIYSVLFFVILPAFTFAADWENHEVINRLLIIPGPSAPVVHENFVIFTASSEFRSVGVAFAHENFFPVHRFRQLIVPQDRLNAPIPPGQREPNPFRDSGIQFFVYQIPENLRELEYRLVVNGLWTADPHNPVSRRDPVSGLIRSIVSIPAMPLRPNPLRGLPDGLNFTFHGPPGEIVTVAGNFNGWDPFMYQLTEGPAGVYSILIPLPPGTYHYVFFHRGERFPDPYNSARVYSREGRAASEIVIP